MLCPAGLLGSYDGLSDPGVFPGPGGGRPDLKILPRIDGGDLWFPASGTKTSAAWLGSRVSSQCSHTPVQAQGTNRARGRFQAGYTSICDTRG